MFSELDRTIPDGVWEPVAMQGIMLNKDQAAAKSAILEWLEGDESFFLLAGAAGTGKTYTIRGLIAEIHGKIIFTAPTNKATKVLREMLTEEDYKPICRTIYSLLGLKLEANGEVKVLKSPEDPIDLGNIYLIVVDEASMVNVQLMREIEKAVDNYGLRFLFLGDSNQLPPVGERASQVWEMVPDRRELVKVMRFDNQILALADRIKAQVNHPAPNIYLKSDNNGVEGVWKMGSGEFRQAIRSAAAAGDFVRTGGLTKAIAWRNATVAEINLMVRNVLFDNARENLWLVGDRIILTGPANDFEKRPMGCTDDEGTVDRVEVIQHPIHHEFLCYSLSVITDENKRISLLVLHPESDLAFRFHQSQLANDAKLTPRRWKDYWEFLDVFHKVQHGYAITAHRAQGSTYRNCFVAWNDILTNRNRNEAFRCLYVAITRPQRKLVLGEW